MKAIYIQDLVARHEGKAEKKLSASSTIRFEIGKKSWAISFEDDGLVIYKKHNHGINGDQVIVKPMVNNKIRVE